MLKAIEVSLQCLAQMELLLDDMLARYTRGNLTMDEYTENLCSIIIALNSIED